MAKDKKYTPIAKPKAFLEKTKKATGVTLAKTKKGKNGSQDVWLENEFDPNSVNAILVRLGNRRRQLMDFVDDFSRDVNGPQHAASQDAHASLTING